MSDLADIRRELIAIRDLAARTGQDVAWIKNGMERGSSRMDGHEKRIAKIENANHRSAGFVAGIAAVIGAAAGAVGAKLGL